MNSLEVENYDLVILGSGTGSKFLAWTFAEQGKRVATIERKYLGGSCPNIACLPSKNVIQSAKIASYFRRGREFGITSDGFTVNMSAVRDRKRSMVSDLIELHRKKYEQSGGEIILGSGRFVGPRTLEVALPEWNNAPAPRSERDRQHRHTRPVGANPRPCRVAAAHAH